MSFSEKVLQIVSKIPKGKVATYGQIASLVQNLNIPSKTRLASGGKDQNDSPSPSEAGRAKIPAKGWSTFGRKTQNYNVKNNQLSPCSPDIFLRKIKISLLARAVGNALAKNPNPVTVPCHRVVKKSGIIGGYKSGVEKKIELLKQEEIGFVGNLRVNLKEHLWKPDVK